MLSQMGIGIIACLAYNMLLGQGGMLSFGHAVYSGMGAFVAIHALNMAGAGTLGLACQPHPIGGRLRRASFFAALFGYVSTKKAARTFAMITLGMGELVFAHDADAAGVLRAARAACLQQSCHRHAFLGITFGPQIQVYYLVAVYCFICTAADVRA